MFSSPYSPFFTSGLLSTTASSSSASSSRPRKDTISSNYSSSDADMQAATDLMSFLSFDAHDNESALPMKRPAPPAQTLPSIPSRKRRNTTSRTPSAVSFQIPAITKARNLARSDTMATRSTASTGYRRAKRSDTLAILEGREAGDAKRIPRRQNTPARRSANFMNFTDNEEEDSDSDSSNDESIDDDDDRDNFVTLLPAYSLPIEEANTKPSVPLVEEEESVIPRPAENPRKALKRRSTISDWLPMQSFMDLKSDSKDEDSWRWRSFIEIAGKA